MAKNKENKGFLEEIIDEVDAMTDSTLREVEEFASDAIFGKQASTIDKQKNQIVDEDSLPQIRSGNLATNFSEKKIVWQRYVELRKKADSARKSAEDAYKRYCEIK